jgi:hypothetical protein
MSLSTWSYPFYDDVPIDKRTTARKKINQTLKRSDTDDDDLADFKPVKNVPQVPAEPSVVQEDLPVLPSPPMSMESSTNSSLSDRINYMIQLLEEQKDEKTGRVTEEIILYVFLGIFVIFVLDSFVKTGKYSR